MDNSVQGLVVRRVVVEGSIAQEHAMTSLLIVRSAKLLPILSIMVNQSTDVSDSTKVSIRLGTNLLTSQAMC